LGDNEQRYDNKPTLRKSLVGFVHQESAQRRAKSVSIRGGCMIRYLLAVSTLCLFSLPGLAAVIDFEPPPCFIPDCGINKTNWSEDGFVVSGKFTHMDASNWSNGYSSTFNNGSEGAIRTAIDPASEVTLSHGAGSLFNLESVEIAPYGSGHGAPEVTFIGLKASGALVSQTFDTSGSNFLEYVFSADFTRLQSVTVAKTRDPHPIFPGEMLVPVASYDRFKASVIPLPPAIWLLGSGLLALAGLRRRRS
jgi:hypothetical protein